MLAALADQVSLRAKHGGGPYKDLVWVDLGGGTGVGTPLRGQPHMLQRSKLSCAWHDFTFAAAPRTPGARATALPAVAVVITAVWVCDVCSSHHTNAGAHAVAWVP